jgi:hypothetical protein
VIKGAQDRLTEKVIQESKAFTNKEKKNMINPMIPVPVTTLRITLFIETKKSRAFKIKNHIFFFLIQTIINGRVGSVGNWNYNVYVHYNF